MVIANPIYDVVFKMLMQDERLARFFIETLLNEPVDSVVVKPQELIYSEGLEQLGNPETIEKIRDQIRSRLSIAVFRLDFIATIKTLDGHKKVLIEIQKARNVLDLMGFRSYLGEQYKRRDEIETSNGKEKVVLPIVTIYLLGFKLPGIDAAVVEVKRQYKNLQTNAIIHSKSDFIEKLTHDCYVVQLPGIKTKYKTRLDRLLNLFEQNYFIDETELVKEYKPDAENEPEINAMYELLHLAGTDPVQKKALEIEQEAYRVFQNAIEETSGKLLRENETLSKEVIEKNKALEEKNKELEEKDKVLEEKERMIAELFRKLNKQ